eukprot:scaffold11537_cov129-Isochrysis_galbana.AAC.3
MTTSHDARLASTRDILTSHSGLTCPRLPASRRASWTLPCHTIPGTTTWGAGASVPQRASGWPPPTNLARAYPQAHLQSLPSPFLSRHAADDWSARRDRKRPRHEGSHNLPCWAEEGTPFRRACLRMVSARGVVSADAPSVQP